MAAHHHNRPLRSRPTSSRLPHNAYGALVGTIDGPLSDADDNHVFLFVRIATGDHAGRYKLAFNTESAQGSSPVQYFVHDEPIAMAEVPGEGFTTDASLSYSEIGLHQADFRTIINGRLRTIVHDSAQDSDLIAAYGFTFSDGTGMHDLHYNNGEPPGSQFPNQPRKDGALAFYYLNRFGESTRRWIFIKFQTQNLA
jgi:uncharacterized protein YukJ